MTTIWAERIIELESKCIALEKEVQILRKLINEMAVRIAAQSELLAKRADKIQ